MSVTRKYCLADSSGEDIYLFTLRNALGTEVLISNYGAIIISFKIKNPDGNFNDIVLGFDNIEDYWSPEYLKQYPWFGCVVGRYANRISNAAFKIDEKEFLLSKNRGDNQLHGGFIGFDKKTWNYVSSGEKPHPFLELKYLSKDGEEGFPGNLDVMIRYELNDDNELSYEFTAITDQPTAVNLTQHSYFNLNNCKGTIHDHEIKIYASNVLEQDEDLIPTGNIQPVENSVFDFRNFKRIGDRLAMISEFDKSFVVDKNEKPDAVSLMAELKLNETKTLLQVFSTEPVVHFYSGKWIPVVNGKNVIKYGSYSGLCLETHKHVNAINIPHFPNTILQPGETYKQKTIYKVSQI
jgi:aldose 1-epimerase